MWNKKHISYIMVLDVRLNVITMQIIQHKSIAFYGGTSRRPVFLYVYMKTVCGEEGEAGRDEMFSGPCSLFLEQTAALKARAAPCHCCEHIAALRIGQLI